MLLVGCRLRSSFSNKSLSFGLLRQASRGTTISRFSSSALPFGTRGGQKNDDDDDDGNNEGRLDATDKKQGPSVVIDASGIPVMTTSTTASSRRNPVVESFFATSTTAEESSSSTKLQEEIHNRAQNLTGFLSSTRRLLHKHPELMYNERKTSAIIQSVLTKLDINDYTTGWAKNVHRERIPGDGGYGIVLDIGSGNSPCVLLRADMDALPIHEQTEGVASFVSQNRGKMHACGHDGHTTMLLGAVSVLKQMEDSINGTVRIMFQPAEEGGAGAKRMREEGVLVKEPRVQRAFGMHVWPTIPSGTIASRPGPLLAAADRFEILIGGVGGHAAMPHLTHDPIVATSAIVMNLQTLVSRTLSPLESGVVSITKLEAGDAFNVIPASSLLRGTIRALSTETLLALRDRVEHVTKTTAAVYGCNVSITYSPDYYPPTMNDPTWYESFSKHVGSMVSSEGYVRDIEPTMGAEDFSFIAESVPSTFFLLGQGSGQDPPTNYGLHHPKFALDEKVLARGVELHVNLALRALKRLTEEKDDETEGVSPATTTATA